MLRIAEEALTFDDVLLVPGYSEVTAKDVSLQTRLSRNIYLNIPLVSAAMDTVTEARLAIALAQEGGIGIIHKSMTIEKQAQEVRAVKKYESGVIKEPLTVGPYTSIQEVIDLTREKNISGVPVVDGDDLVGIVTSRDLRFEKNISRSVQEVMTSENLITAPVGTDLEKAQDILQEYKIEKCPVLSRGRCQPER